MRECRECSSPMCPNGSYEKGAGCRHPTPSAFRAAFALELGDDRVGHFRCGHAAASGLHDVAGPQPIVEHLGNRGLELGRQIRPCRTNSAGPWQTMRTWRSGLAIPLPGDIGGRAVYGLIHAPCACRSRDRARPARPKAACPANRSAWPQRRTRCRRTDCR